MVIEKNNKIITYLFAEERLREQEREREIERDRVDKIDF
jgi:hypothetical protein